MNRFISIGFAAVLATTGFAPVVMAQGAPVQTRDAVRVRLLDGCVLSQSKPGADGGAAPQCRCYASAIAKAMTAEEIAAYAGKMPKRMDPIAEKSWAGCNSAR